MKDRKKTGGDGDDTFRLSMEKRVKRFRKRFRLDSHHAIERFGISFAALMSVGVLVMTLGISSWWTNGQADLSSKSLYVGKFTSSRTNVSGQVDGVYMDPSGTRAMVLMHTKEGDKLPSTADSYQMFLTKVDSNLNQYPLKGSRITGRYVVFGSNASYMAAVLDNPDGFSLDILDMVVRADKEVSHNDSESTSVKSQQKKIQEGDESYQKFDQWRILFNPKASSAQRINLGRAGSDFDAGAVYADTVTASSEKEVRDTMDKQLVEMKADLTRIDQYTTALSTTQVNDNGTPVSIVPPKTPEDIAGDKITGQEPRGGKPSTLFLSARSVVPGGYDFSWRDGSVKNGYLDKVVPEGVSYLDYLQQQTSLNKSEPDFDVAFQLSNGKPLATYSQKDTFARPLLDLQANLTDAWSTYWRHKNTYQTKSYTQLLDLDIALRNVETNTSQRTDKALTLY